MLFSFFVIYYFKLLLFKIKWTKLQYIKCELFYNKSNLHCININKKTKGWSFNNKSDLNLDVFNPSLSSEDASVNNIEWENIPNSIEVIWDIVFWIRKKTIIENILRSLVSWVKAFKVAITTEIRWLTSKIILEHQNLVETVKDWERVIRDVIRDIRWVLKFNKETKSSSDFVENVDENTFVWVVYVNIRDRLKSSSWETRAAIFSTIRQFIWWNADEFSLLTSLMNFTNHRVDSIMNNVIPEVEKRFCTEAAA